MFFCKQKTAYDMRISDWSSDVCSSDLLLDGLTKGQWWQVALQNEKAMAEVEALKKQFDEGKDRLEARFADKVDKLQRGDELPPGVMKIGRASCRERVCQ